MSSQQDVDAAIMRLKMKVRLGTIAKAMIVPSMLLYGLWVTRPRPGHFAQFVAEMRMYHPTFDQNFPPLEDTPDDRERSRHQMSSKDEREERRRRMFEREHVIENGEFVSRIKRYDIPTTATHPGKYSPKDFFKLKKGVLKLMSDEATAEQQRVRIDVRQHWFHTTGTIEFRDAEGKTRETKKYYGIVQFLWREF